MNIKPLKKALFILGIPLLFAGCGDAPEEDAPKEVARNSSAVPKVLPSTLKIKQQSGTYVITGFGMSGTKKAAIINGKVVVPGKELDPGVVLKDVQPTYAVIVHGNTEHLIRPEDLQSELNKKKQ